MPFSYEKITTHFGHIFPTHVEELCELLIILRKQFFGDLDLMLILAIIGSRALPARHAKAMTYDEFLTNNDKNRTNQPINIQSVAECSGIARETVRRKVNKLEELGYVTRNDQGMLKVTAKATTELTASTEASMQYLVALGASSTAFNKEILD
ncbi:MAG: DeoR family transcriptional regulator [Oceanisphaera sp.]|uniref:DeoR family transcriptional regulator n=1 Tax=Oceanisphaera sp. TaxID=1929979 RepID=UPI003F9ADF0B